MTTAVTPIATIKVQHTTAPFLRITTNVELSEYGLQADQTIYLSRSSKNDGTYYIATWNYDLCKWACRCPATKPCRHERAINADCKENAAAHRELADRRAVRAAQQKAQKMFEEINTAATAAHNIATQPATADEAVAKVEEVFAGTSENAAATIVTPEQFAELAPFIAAYAQHKQDVREQKAAEQEAAKTRPNYEASESRQDDRKTACPAKNGQTQAPRIGQVATPTLRNVSRDLILNGFSAGRNGTFSGRGH